MPDQVTLQNDRAGTALAVRDRAEAVMVVWDEQRDLIRQIVAPDSTPQEFLTLCAYGKEIGANPLKREIFFQKYRRGDGTFDVSITVARDFHRRRAQEHETHRGQVVVAHYERDEFEEITTKDGVEVKHARAKGDRGRLLGAFSLTFDDRYPRPHYEYVNFSDYNKGRALWKSSPEVMIKKVASATGYRATYTGTLGGVYDEAEDWAPTTSGNLRSLPPTKGAATVPTPEEVVAANAETTEAPAAVEAPAAAPTENEEPPEPLEKTWDNFDGWARECGASEPAINAIHAKYAEDIDEAIRFMVGRKESYKAYTPPPFLIGGDA